MREGLARLIADECDLEVADSAASAAELRACIGRKRPAVLIMELVLHNEDGLTLIRDLLEATPDLRIVVFTFQPEDVYAVRCFRAGIKGFVGKRDSVGALFRAVREVIAGGMVVPAGVSQGMVSAAPTAKAATNGVAGQLTDRELQVFRLVGLAQPTRVIAGKLGVSVKTIETHREHIKNKLALQSHDELVARAAQWVRESNGS
jgi:two-component system, NarL family, response regulator NreC